ncbi:MAG: hypothetical protein HN842_05940 [Gammaproteobacteria bacterium]|jgi:hypothetical protein|nr:hypothetical protein [Gammaproteobacteria bacterium]MBT7307738.1 hypothetical protein [Gammaproteobacteria bacterium]
MTLKKYLKGLTDLFDEKQRKCKKEKECLLVALKKLKKRKYALKKKLDKQGSEKSRKRVKNELKVISVQRRNGLAQLKELKNK